MNGVRECHRLATEESIYRMRSVDSDDCCAGMQMSVEMRSNDHHAAGGFAWRAQILAAGGFLPAIEIEKASIVERSVKRGVFKA